MCRMSTNVLYRLWVYFEVLGFLKSSINLSLVVTGLPVLAVIVTSTTHEGGVGGFPVVPPLCPVVVMQLNTGPQGMSVYQRYGIGGDWS